MVITALHTCIHSAIVSICWQTVIGMHGLLTGSVCPCGSVPKYMHASCHQVKYMRDKFPGVKVALHAGELDYDMVSPDNLRCDEKV
jgi:hypothetical protein